MTRRHVHAVCLAYRLACEAVGRVLLVMPFDAVDLEERELTGADADFQAPLYTDLMMGQAINSGTLLRIFELFVQTEDGWWLRHAAVAHVEEDTERYQTIAGFLTGFEDEDLDANPLIKPEEWDEIFWSRALTIEVAYHDAIVALANVIFVERTVTSSRCEQIVRSVMPTRHLSKP